MGKIITFNNLHLYPWKNLRQNEISKTEVTIIEKLCDGKLSTLMDFYLLNNEPNDEINALRYTFTNAQKRTPEVVYGILEIIANKDEYFLPFLASKSSLSDATNTISKISKPMTLKLWNEISREKVIPMNELRSANTYSHALSKIEKLYEDGLLFSVNGLPDYRRNELESLDIETYTEAAYRELWGYDDDTVSLIYNLDKIFDKLYSESTDKYNEMNLEVALRYIEAFRKRTVPITDGDKRLLRLMNNYPASFGYAHSALFDINEISPAGDRILQAKTDYEQINAEISMKKDNEKLETRKRTIKKTRIEKRYLPLIILAILCFFISDRMPGTSFILMILIFVLFLFSLFT
jgi:hypothetical protein